MKLNTTGPVVSIRIEAAVVTAHQIAVRGEVREDFRVLRQPMNESEWLLLDGGDPSQLARTPAAIGFASQDRFQQAPGHQVNIESLKLLLTEEGGRSQLGRGEVSLLSHGDVLK